MHENEIKHFFEDSNLRDFAVYYFFMITRSKASCQEEFIYQFSKISSNVCDVNISPKINFPNIFREYIFFSQKLNNQCCYHFDEISNFFYSFSRFFRASYSLHLNSPGKHFFIARNKFFRGNFHRRICLIFPNVCTLKIILFSVLLCFLFFIF